MMVDRIRELREDYRRRRRAIAAERRRCAELDKLFGAELDALSTDALHSLLTGVYGRGADMQAQRLARVGLTSWHDRLPLLEVLEVKAAGRPGVLPAVPVAPLPAEVQANLTP